jgi:hypothetical protein
MGLDMFAFAVKQSDLPKEDQDVEVDVKLGENIPKTEVFYWRKHHDLHGWMQNLYVQKGGVDPDFNCNTVRLTYEDLDELEKDLNGQDLPETTGFFFGNNPPDQESLNNDLDFISKARNMMDEGYAVFYDSWW